MSTIEQAAKRLEQLRRAGVEIVDPQQDAQTTEAKVPVGSGQAEQLTAATPLPAQAPAPAPATSAPEASQWADSQQGGSDRRSRTVNLDLLRMSRAGLLVPGNPRSQLEEEFRIIKRPLLENLRSQSSMRPERANLIMVTSAVPSEGKTQTAINLAISIAMELDHTVLLVEADVLRPSALERMGLQARHGLLDLLSGQETDLADVLLKTNIPKLSVLPAGVASSRSTELLASDAMNGLLEELANKYSDRVIVFDTPPLLSTTESRVLAANMGQVVMVVEASKTPVTAVRQAFATIEDHPVVLTMLNKYRGPKNKNSYGYYAP